MVVVRISYEPLAGSVVLLLAGRGSLGTLGGAVTQAVVRTGLPCWQTHCGTVDESLRQPGSQSSCP